MLYDCTDFIYNDQSLSDLGYMIVSFDAGNDVSLNMERTIEKSERNRFREHVNTFGAMFTNEVTIHISIMKDICKNPDQDVQKIPESELRQIARWLTSNSYPLWLETKTNKVLNEIRYKGFFTNIEPVFFGNLYGLSLTFVSTSPFGYTHEIKNENTIVGRTFLNILNNSDVINGYTYPQILLKPKIDEDVLLVNLSDTKILQENTFVVPEQSTAQETLLLMTEQINDYAYVNGYTIDYEMKNDLDIQGYCNDTTVSFYLTDSCKRKIKCVAYYENNHYHIYQGGFMIIKVFKDLDYLIDSEKCMIFDSIGRPVLFDKLGIKDVDYMYWLRLRSGNNSIMCHADNCIITFTHNEARKVGAY